MVITKIDDKALAAIQRHNRLLNFAMETWENAFQLELKEHSDDDIIEPLNDIIKACDKLEKYLLNENRIVVKLDRK